MTKSLKLGLLSASALVLLSGCVSSPVSGSLYTGTKHSVGGTGVYKDGSANAEKTGTSTCTSILTLFAFGDCTAETAAADAGITKIKSVSQDATNILGIIQTYDTIVVGE